MRSSGEILKSERLKKNWSLDEVARRTKIRVELLKAIEEGNFTHLPSEVYLKGFVKTYARVLGLNPEQVLPFFRRDYTKKGAPEKTPPQPLSRPLITWTPGTVLSLLVSAAIIIFLATLFWQYQTFTGTPLLLVSEPTDGVVLERPLVDVVGKTDPGVFLTVNGEAVRVDENGLFQTSLELKPGKTTLRIVAKNKLGKETVVERVVSLKNKEG